MIDTAFWIIGALATLVLSALSAGFLFMWFRRPSDLRHHADFAKWLGCWLFAALHARAEYLESLWEYRDKLRAVRRQRAAQILADQRDGWIA